MPSERRDMARLREVHVRCSQCGTTVPEGEATCPTCGTSVAEIDAYALAAAQVAYEPGPSFVDAATLPLDAREMPNWLQEFGASVASDETTKADDANPVAPPSTGEADTTMPRWLAEPRPGAPATPVFTDLPWDTDEPGDDATPASASFISEDDLPEWLRAISGDVAAQPEHAAASTPAASSNGGFPVPAVVQAWVIAHQMVALAAGESLMAHLAAEDETLAEPQLDESMSQRSVPTSAAVDASLSVASDPQAKARNMRLVLLVLLILAVLGLLVIYRSVA
jgi:hypothetical protein